MTRNPPVDSTDPLIVEMVAINVPLTNGRSLDMRYSEVWVGEELVRQIEVWENTAVAGYAPKYHRRAAVLR